ncbi:MAG: hypothetical protein AAB110_06240 [Candidatus Desantisbacteria bacterium]
MIIKFPAQMLKNTPMGAEYTDLQDINESIKTGMGNPYIPGSSLKESTHLSIRLSKN